MKKERTEEEKQYTKPEITDHGDLTELTAGLAHGTLTDASFKTHQTATFVSGP